MRDTTNSRDIARAITAECWSRLSEPERHAWRRLVLTGGTTPAKDAVSVVIDPHQVSDVDAILLAEALHRPGVRLELEAARHGVLPFVAAAAVPLAQALDLSSRIVGIPHGVVPCHPDPTWRNDGPWWSIVLAEREGVALVQATGVWTPSLRRAWVVTELVNGRDRIVTRLPALTTAHGQRELEFALAPYRGTGVSLHPDFRSSRIPAHVAHAP